MTRLPSIGTPGISRGREPVARRIRAASSSVTLPSLATRTWPLPASLPSPGTTATLFFFMRYSTPLDSFLAAGATSDHHEVILLCHRLPLHKQPTNTAVLAASRCWAASEWVLSSSGADDHGVANIRTR